ncbi:hypothetical protein OTB20_32830 [Streptomyces sp. H27-H1]|uniref:hypothetical protein n=1 Tax=Streptomyces sp. H27-H1 TaxID=2996461 RepID=UPI00226F33DD|nr:hypothetical protein [Streptomyces sp. H27-H1]MCY0930896.1 hypothetical protein [Streptomyces sp. H27-H1]
MAVSQWRNRDHLLFRALKTHPAINWIAATALVIVIVQQWLLTTPQLFAGGAAVGEVLFDLSLATLAAWVFHLVVVVIPRLRAERLLLAQEHGHLRGASGAAAAVLRAMSASAGNPLPDPLPALTLAKVTTICENVDLQVSPEDFAPGSWQDYLVYEADRATRRHQRIEAAYAFLPVELVAILRGLAAHAYVKQIEALKNLPMSNEHPEFLAPSLYAYLQKCSELGKYLDEKVEPVLP